MRAIEAIRAERVVAILRSVPDTARMVEGLVVKPGLLTAAFLDLALAQIAAWAQATG